VKTQKRQLLWALRARGWGFDEQVKALRLACTLFPVDLGVMEHNSFQRWVHDETLKYPETAGKIVGHNTGPEKQELQEGVPGLAISLAQRLWTIASGDKDALRYARTLADGAAGVRLEGRQAAGRRRARRHRDRVLAARTGDVRLINTLLRQGEPEQYIGG
jgi:hypothetical protein